MELRCIKNPFLWDLLPKHIYTWSMAEELRGCGKFFHLFICSWKIVSLSKRKIFFCNFQTQATVSHSLNYIFFFLSNFRWDFEINLCHFFASSLNCWFVKVFLFEWMQCIINKSTNILDLEIRNILA